LGQALFDEVGGDALFAEVFGEFGGGVIESGGDGGLLARGDHVAGRGERVYKVYEGWKLTTSTNMTCIGIGRFS